MTSNSELQVFKECRVQSESGNSYELSVAGGKCNQNKVLDASETLKQSLFLFSVFSQENYKVTLYFTTF